MKKGSAAVWIVWIILTILIAGGLVYYYQYTKIPDLQNQINDLKNQVASLQEQINNQEDETADWQTYANERFEYSLKYPKDWFLYDKGFLNVETKKYELPQKTVFIDSKEIEDIPSGSDYPLADFNINVEDDEITYDQIREDASITFSEVKVSGESALKGISKTPSEFDQSFGTYYYINHSSRLYLISWPNKNAAGDHDEIFDQIFESFQFTD